MWTLGFLELQSLAGVFGTEFFSFFFFFFDTLSLVILFYSLNFEESNFVSQVLIGQFRL